MARKNHPNHRTQQHKRVRADEKMRRALVGNLLMQPMVTR